jgi:hypothetical protein
MPAKAGIQRGFPLQGDWYAGKTGLDPRFRGDDNLSQYVRHVRTACQEMNLHADRITPDKSG